MDEKNINEAKKEIQQVAKAANKAKSGNIIGAAKELLKSKEFRKKLKRKLIIYGLQVAAVMILISCLVASIFAIKDVMVDLLSKASGFISKAWQWMTDDYWIKLDEGVDYIIDEDTGEVLGISGEVSDEELLNDKRKTKKYKNSNFYYS